jgi:hypothetical protein
VKLTVVLARYPEGTPKAGQLAAYVVTEDDKRGRNLLAGMSITRVPYAQTMAKREINWLLPGAQVKFEGPEGEVASANGRGGK